jgi:hypothetical protein
MITRLRVSSIRSEDARHILGFEHDIAKERRRLKEAGVELLQLLPFQR